MSQHGEEAYADDEGAILILQRPDAAAPRRAPALARRDGGRRPLVKLVVAIVRPEKANDVLEALFRADVQGLTISRVQGHGGETEQVETYRGTTVKMELHEKVRFEIGVSDHFVEPTVQGDPRRRPHRRGRRRQGLRAAGREDLPDPHRRGGPRGGHAGAGGGGRQGLSSASGLRTTHPSSSGGGLFANAPESVASGRRRPAGTRLARRPAGMSAASAATMMLLHKRGTPALLLPEFLKEVYLGQRTGLLHVTRGESAGVSFRSVNGELVSGSSSDERGRLGETMVRRGLISRADLERALVIVSTRGRRLAPVLRDLDLVDTPGLEQALALHIREMLRDGPRLGRGRAAVRGPGAARRTRRRPDAALLDGGADPRSGAPHPGGRRRCSGPSAASIARSSRWTTRRSGWTASRSAPPTATSCRAPTDRRRRAP